MSYKTDMSCIIDMAGLLQYKKKKTVEDTNASL